MDKNVSNKEFEWTKKYKKMNYGNNVFQSLKTLVQYLKE